MNTFFTWAWLALGIYTMFVEKNGELGLGCLIMSRLYERG